MTIIKIKQWIIMTNIMIRIIKIQNKVQQSLSMLIKILKRIKTIKNRMIIRIIQTPTIVQ